MNFMSTEALNLTTFTYCRYLVSLSELNSNKKRRDIYVGLSNKKRFHRRWKRRSWS